ncbi:MAG TPA: glycosyltransferase [Pyrinomonadaceae bacterium]|nr:glycosyltransferase [Pyrinomonadaceae bacterium]
MNSRETFGRDSPLVSVIIPCYNQGHYLSEAIESVLNQSYPHFEIIVVDDGSTDNTGDVARGYKEVKLLSQENQGRPAVGRNRGLRESSGRYVVFLDADDHLLPDALEIGVRLLEAHPEYAFVSGHCRAMGPEGEPLPVKQLPCVEKEHYLALLRQNYIWTPGVVMFRRAVLESAGGFNIAMEMKGSEDYDLYLRIARESPVHCHQHAVVVYREHGSSLSSNAATMLKSTLTVHRAQWPFVKGDHEREQAYREGRRKWKEFYGSHLVEKVRSQVRKRAEWGQAAHSIKVLLRYHPKEFFTQAYRKLYCLIFRVKA